QSTFSGHGGEDCITLGANRKSIRRILDVAAAMNVTGFGEHRRANQELRIWRVSTLHRLTRSAQKRIALFRRDLRHGGFGRLHRSPFPTRWLAETPAQREKTKVRSCSD